MKFIHLSDLHIHSDPADNLHTQAMFRNILANWPQHGLIVTGDITDDGAEGQYKNAAGLLSPFLGRVYICPGNHDFGAMGNLYSRERAERFDDTLSRTLNQGGTFTGDKTPVVNIIKEGDHKILLIALDSNLETVHPLDFACGKIGKEQRDALDTILATSSRDMTRVVFFHHHPFMHTNSTMKLQDADEVMSILAGRVDLVLFGHKHEARHWTNIPGIPHVLASTNTPNPAQPAWEITISQGKITIGTLDLLT